MHFLNRFRRAYRGSDERNDNHEVSLPRMTRGLRLTVVGCRPVRLEPNMGVTPPKNKRVTCGMWRPLGWGCLLSRLLLYKQLYT